MLTPKDSRCLLGQWGMRLLSDSEWFRMVIPKDANWIHKWFALIPKDSRWFCNEFQRIPSDFYGFQLMPNDSSWFQTISLLIPSQIPENSSTITRLLTARKDSSSSRWKVKVCRARSNKSRWKISAAGISLAYSRCWWPAATATALHNS